MKKYISLIAAAAALVFAACAQIEGTEPGNDTTPYVGIYQYNPGGDYNPDNDIAIRITANNKVDEVYYLYEPVESYTSNLEAKGEAGYAEYVKANGVKADVQVSEFDGAKVFSTVLTGIKGSNQIVVAGISSGASALASTNFVGLSWTVLAKGTFTSVSLDTRISLGPIAATLEKCDQIEGRYRFPDLIAPGYHRVFETVGGAQKDSGGDTFFTVRCANQEIGVEFGSYGMMSARDVATWQGSDDYLVYNYFYPDDNYVCIWTQYNVSAGNLGYGDDIFKAN